MYSWANDFLEEYHAFCFKTQCFCKRLHEKGDNISCALYINIREKLKLYDILRITPAAACRPAVSVLLFYNGIAKEKRKNISTAAGYKKAV
ncbi:hypothetical protein [Kingella potus]|uniref:hypothetical protein n=1 Tax=Kingella potus TaxID=265175 RepID=UPI000E1B75C7